MSTDVSEISLIRGDIAIIGMSCVFPKAENVDAYWQNIISKVDAIIDVPSDRWDTDTFFDPDQNAEEYLHCKRGGYLPASLLFNPLAHGVMPVALEGAEPDQFLLLQLVHDALEDAGYLNNTDRRTSSSFLFDQTFSFSKRKSLDGKRTEIIAGKGNYLGAGHANLIQRRIVAEQTIGIIQDLHPEYTDDELRAIKRELLGCLRNFNSETAPSLVPNITTGRVSNRLDFMGPNYTVDAACASSLIATDLAVKDLLTKKCDMAIVGGVHICNDLPFLMLFEALHAVSVSSQIRPFDKKADGTLTGEGIGVVVLKRLEDAERDEDRIYAVIKGVGTSSDGRATSVVAPRVEGGELALRRAYQMAGIDPKTVELIEAHGTGTVVGDASEIEILTRVLGARDTESPPRCAVGTVKSMIGHAMPAAGMAALIKTALALYHKVLPPTLHCEEPNPKFELEKKNFYINTETRPWIHGQQDIPRRAGVNAFGLGGVNAHVVLEEYRGTDGKGAKGQGGKEARGQRGSDHLAILPSCHLALHHHYQWDSELFILQGDSRQGLIQQAQQLQQYVDQNPHSPLIKGGRGVVSELKDLAYTLNTQNWAIGQEGKRAKQPPAPSPLIKGGRGVVGKGDSSLPSSPLAPLPLSEIRNPYRLALVASSLDELQKKLSYAIQRLTDPECKQIKDIKGTFFFEEPLFQQGGKLAFLFPGEGAQYLNMLLDLCLHFPEVRECFDRTDQAFINQHRAYLPSQIVFPAPAFTKEEQKKAEERLFNMDGALETVLTANWALTNLLDSLEIRPDMVVGHSSGEFSALLASGVSEANDDYFRNLSILNTYYERAAADGEIPEAAMIAVGVDYDSASAIIREIDGEIYVAMDNCPHQVVVVGEEKSIQQAIEQFRSKGIMYEKLSFNRAYHTPIFQNLCEKLRAYFVNVPMTTPKVEIYSCTTMAPFPKAPEDIRNLVIDHWKSPVQFRKTIEAMYDAGARIFVEVGPKGNLITFVDDILRGRPYLAMSSNVPRRSGITQLNHLVGILAAHGVPMRLDYLYARRSPRRLSLDTQVEQPNEVGVESSSATEKLSEAEIQNPRLGSSPKKIPPSPPFPKGGRGDLELRLDFPSLRISEARKKAAKATRKYEAPAELPVTSHRSPVTSAERSEPKAEGVGERSEQNLNKLQQGQEGKEARGQEGKGAKESRKEENDSEIRNLAKSSVSNANTSESPTSLQGSRNQPTQEISSDSSTSGTADIVVHEVNSPSKEKTERSEHASVRMNREYSFPIQHNPKAFGVGERSEHSQTMVQYLQTMEHFLEVQQEVMQAYLRQDGKEARGQDSRLAVLPQGHETERQVEHSDFVRDEQTIQSRTYEQSEKESLMAADKAPPEINTQSLTQTLLGIVSEKTGYPIEMLDLNLDMEADLGIDSIKRIEILGSFQEQYSLLQSIQDEQIDMEQVASLKSLQQVIDFISKQMREAIPRIGEGQDSKRAKGLQNSLPLAPLPLVSTSIADASEIDLTPPPCPLPLSTSGEGKGVRSFPFIDSVTSLVPGQELVAVRRIDWKGEDIFMEDHTFGPEISGTDDTLKGLPVIPLTVGMEIMAEAAALLIPDKQLIALKDIKAHQWIHIENPTTINIIARRRVGIKNEEGSFLNSDLTPHSPLHKWRGEGSEAQFQEVEVQMWNPDGSAETLTSPDSPLMEGIMVFGDSFPEPPSTEETFPLRSERRPKRTAKEVYDEHYLFHGLRFHNIVSLDRMGEDGLVGYLEVLPTDNLFKSKNPFFITDPFLMDAVGQLVGYWPIENLEKGFLIFPIRVQEVILYGPTRPVSERVKCHLRIQEITSTRIRANIDVIGSDGRLWIRVIGWQDWRFYFPQDLFDFWRFTNRGMVSAQWNTPIYLLPSDISESLECYQIKERFGDLGSTIWETVWAYLILNQNERIAYWNMVKKKLENRRMDWLLGRTTAKDAVRMWFRKHHGVELYPADIEIGEDDYGHPAPKGRWTQEIGIIPTLSMSHADRMAVAIAGPPNQRLGVDIEQIREREQGFVSLAFTEEESTLLNSLETSIREEWMTRFWCAKESVGKALGRGLIEGPKSLVVQELDAQTGTVKVVLQGKLSEAFPEFAGAQIVVYTAKEENYIVASTICEIIRET
jgi:acyl transferase domain-containing protein/phosphopantetheinyl transferase